MTIPNIATFDHGTFRSRILSLYTTYESWLFTSCEALVIVKDGLFHSWFFQHHHSPPPPSRNVYECLVKESCVPGSKLPLFPYLGDKLINPIVGVYIPIIRIPIEGGRSPISNKTRLLTMAYLSEVTTGLFRANREFHSNFSNFSELIVSEISYLDSISCC